jgi:hypothetical protein
VENVSDDISGGMREMRFKHLDNDIDYLTSNALITAILRYKSPNIEKVLNTRIFIKAGNDLLGYKPLVCSRLSLDMGWIRGLMDSNDRFFI